MPHKKYSAYKPSGVEWLEQIPQHWDVMSLKRIASIVNGATPSSGVPDYWDGQILWATPEDISRVEGRYLSSTRRTITEVGYNSCGTSLFPKGSVIITTRAPIGNVAIAAESMCINQGCKALLPSKEAVNATYLYYTVLTLVPVLQSLGKGTTFMELGTQSLGDIPINLPPLYEQQAIASYLDQKTALIDSTIRQKERLIELLQEERTAIINRAVTRGLDPNVPMKDSGVEWIGEIPEHWVTKPLKRLVEYNSEVIPESTDEDEVIHYIEISDVDCNRGVHNSTIYTFKDAPSRARRIVRSGDTLISTVRTYLKAVGIVESKHNGYIASTGFCVLRPKHFNHRFQGYLGQSRFIEEVSRRSVGVSYPAINATDLVEIEVPHPPLSEQQAIASYLDQKTVLIDDTILKNRQQISALTEYRTALINEVVTGKRCVT